MSNVSAVLKPEPHTRTLDIGLKSDYLEEMSGKLGEILAETYQLVIKSHVYHWNVVGPLFKPIHELTEEHYNELFEATDIIAERVRALGHLAPGKMGQVIDFAPKKKDISNLSANDIVEDLISTHEAAVRTMRSACKLAGDNDDVVTEDMLTQRMTFHEKALWMLRAIIAH